MSFIVNLQNIRDNFTADFTKISDLGQVEELRVSYLGKKSAITQFFTELKNLEGEEKKLAGQQINQLRQEIAEKIEEKKTELEKAELNEKLQGEFLDLSAPERQFFKGSIHPLSKTIAEIEYVFQQLGFEFADSGEIEDDFHNFTALNMPKNHPARQMQDTFYLQNAELLLRTHTSNTQIHKLKTAKPPLKICSIGRVFRRDSDQTHTPMFHQLEGFVLDEAVNMSDLRALLEKFLAIFFETDSLKLRFRPSFFPFTEPSAEVDVNYRKDSGRIMIGAGESFMEILGCGMIHPQVLRNCEINPEKFRGFAFGIGIERLAMLKYGITDLRMMFEGDMRFLSHYGFSTI